MRHHNNASHYCDKCHKGTSSKALMDQHHTSRHDDGERWKCSEADNGCAFKPAASKFHLSESYAKNDYAHRVQHTRISLGVNFCTSSSLIIKDF